MSVSTSTSPGASRAAAMAGPGSRQAVAQRFTIRGLVKATPVTLAVALVAVLVIRYVAVHAAGSTAGFTPLTVAAELPLTIIGVLAAAGAWLLLNRRVAAPVPAFQRLAVAALGISLVPDLVVWVTGAYPHTGAGTVLPLMAMHVLVAGTCLTILPRLGADSRLHANRRAGAIK